MPHVMRTSDVLSAYRDGDEHGWAVEFDYLRKRHAERIATLLASVAQHGIQAPVHLGADGRVWDGHHRLCVAQMLGLEFIPVTTDPKES